jgi:GTP:adenosylcobinamide-phosphate guanylyltransferase
MTPDKGLTALILAGNRRGKIDPMAAAAGVSHKALLPVDGTPMILHVIRALQACPAVHRIIVSTERTDILSSFVEAHTILIRPSATSPSRSVAASLLEFGAPLLVTTADHALLTPEILQSFLSQAPDEADAAAGVARSDVIRAVYPNTRRTWLRMRDGDFSGCNLFLLRTLNASRAVDFWQRLEQQRKSPVAMARTIGLAALFRYAFKTLTMRAAVRLLGHRTGTKLAIVELLFADAAVDVDKAADLLLVDKTFAERRAA